MSGLSPSQRAKLEALWRSLPSKMRAALHASAKAAGGGDEASLRLVTIFDGLEESVGEPAGENARSYLLRPLGPLISADGNDPPSKARFTTDQVSKVWGWIARHLAKGTIEKARKCKKPPSDPIWYEFQRELADALDEGIQRAERVPKDMTALAKRFGADSGEMLRDIVVLLRHGEVLQSSLDQLPPRIFELDEDLCYKLKELHDSLMEETPEAAVWVFLFVIGRMDSPWEIFRAIKKIGRRDDDLVVAKTELAAIGDAILADTGYFASQLKVPPATLEEARHTFHLFDRFVSFSTGMTQEFGIRKAGRWGQSLFSLRAEASGNAEKIFEKVPLALDSGLPEPRRGRSGRIIPAQLPQEPAIERAEGLIYFLAAAREHANAAAVASAQKRIYETVVTRLQDAGELLVDLVADSEGQNRIVAQEGLDITARFLEAAQEPDLAATLRRRGNAATAA